MSLGCLRCAREYPEPALELLGAGCPACAADGVPANVLPVLDIAGLRREPPALPRSPGEPGLFVHRELLPLDPGTPAVSLGEGGTPVVDLPELARGVGVARLLVKDETRNPTWSYKDRLAAVSVTKATELGVDTVVVCSTGNHGAAVAAYAARAGLRCVVLTLASVPQAMKTLMGVYGATVAALRTGPERWALMRELVAERGWMPMSGHADPPVGSPSYGIDGYKTIAYELFEQLPGVPDVVVVPTAYADGLTGIARGFDDLCTLGLADRVPRLLAAEPFGPLRSALAAGTERAGPVPAAPSVSFSIASPVGTYQGLRALRRSGGGAVAVPDDETVLAAQRRLGRHGLYLEASSAITLPALEAWQRAGLVGPEDTVVLVGTSTGLKDVGATAAGLPAVPLIEARPEALDTVLERADAPLARQAP
ncbi:threonine synthase [Pseudonocardia adelaidensis]|uniref:Threonine synthase n=1 Tax=Pseudonocardia adelaidensis TaxID=648754 RepID=A0ABP9NJ82_9PSEU